MSARDEAWRWLEQAGADLLANTGMIARTHSLSPMERLLGELGVVLQHVRARAVLADAGTPLR